MLTSLALAGLLLTTPAARPAVGDVAPDVELASSAGGAVKLSDYKGKKSVVLAFFPKAFTGG
jgi:thioredoxin-dependent peroxiredoxin